MYFKQPFWLTIDTEHFAVLQDNSARGRGESLGEPAGVDSAAVESIHGDRWWQATTPVAACTAAAVQSLITTAAADPQVGFVSPGSTIRMGGCVW